MKRNVELVVCYEKDDSFGYWLHPYSIDSLIVNFDLLDLSVVRSQFSGGNIYLIGYLYEGKFFDQLCYLGKGSK